MKFNNENQSELKTFTLYRRFDAANVSGEGRVLDGVVFHNGWVAVCWRTDVDASRNGHTSISFYPTWETFSYLHIDAHPENESVIVFGEPSELAGLLEKRLSDEKNP